MIKNKKGTTDHYAFLLVVLSLFILVYTVKVFVDSPSNLDFEIGAIQAKFVGLIEDGERDLFETDEIVKIAANRALVKLGSSGGLDSNCVSGGIVEWNGNCYVSDDIVKQNFINYFQEEFESLMSIRGMKYSGYELVDSTLYGESISSHFTYESKEEGTWGFKKKVNGEEGVPYNSIIHYEVKPNFGYNTEFDFGIYEEILNKFKTDIECRAGCTCFSNINQGEPNWNSLFRCENTPSGEYTFTMNKEVVVDGRKESIVIKFKINDYNNL